MMIRLIVTDETSEVCYHGLRMTAEQFLRLPESECKYELIDGVVVMSPSARLWHQNILTEIASEISTYLRGHPLGKVYVEVDVHLGAAEGRSLVYRPDVTYLAAERAAASQDQINVPPDVVVEVVSDDSRQYDTITKKNDYETCGVREYWLIDPLLGTVTFYVRKDDRFVARPPQGDEFASQAIPGLVLDLKHIRGLFPKSNS